MHRAITGLVLAAGRGTRFGGHKGLALMSDGVPMAVRSALNLKAVVDRVLCVVRADDIELQDVLTGHGLDVIKAIHADLGMSASLKAGIVASADSTGWMIGLGDMPLIQHETYQALVSKFCQEGGIVVPEIAGRQGHPVIFPACYRAELLALVGDKGARSLLTRHVNDVNPVPATDPGILQDFDTAPAFSTLLKGTSMCDVSLLNGPKSRLLR